MNVSQRTTRVNLSPRNGGWGTGAAKRMKRPVGTPAPLPIAELTAMYARRARVAQQMAAKAAAKAEVSA